MAIFDVSTITDDIKSALPGWAVLLAFGAFLGWSAFHWFDRGHDAFVTKTMMSEQYQSITHSRDDALKTLTVHLKNEIRQGNEEMNRRLNIIECRQLDVLLYNYTNDIEKLQREQPLRERDRIELQKLQSRIESVKIRRKEISCGLLGL